MNALQSELMEMLYLLPAVIIGFSVHEYAHALFAVRLGDETPRIAGRFTLNPLKHLDPIGLAMVLLFGFGWARPVSYNPANLKKPIEHSVLIALAGPFSNLLLAILCAGLYKVASLYQPPAPLLIILSKMVSLNAMLFVFNLFPFPPLDGSHLVFWAIPERYQALRLGYLKYGYWLLAGLILAQAFLKVDLLPVGALVRSLIALLSKLFNI